MTPEERLELIKQAVSYQADDAGIWFHAEHVGEAHLQLALRHLHFVVEGDEYTAKHALQEIKESMECAR